MRNIFNSEKFGRVWKPGIVAPVALIGVFWGVQILACNIISSSMLASLSRMAGELSFGAFLVLFIIRLIRPGSRWPALLGFGSLGAMLAFQWLALNSGNHLYIGHRIQLIEIFMWLSMGLDLAGIALDVKRCWSLVAKAILAGPTSINAAAMPAAHGA